MKSANLSPLESLRMQINALLRQIRSLKESEFPYQHSRDALDRIEEHFTNHMKKVMTLDEKSHPGVISAACGTACDSIASALPLLGFILRSTNVRNAFEVCGPLLRLARSVLGSQSKLVVSSEWEFSPFTFIGYRPLPGFVLIGLPATESANPFLIPLAGHELGHSAWVQFNYEHSVRGPIQKNIVEAIKSQWSIYSNLFPDVRQDELETSLFASQTWEPAAHWAIRQAEECFCDLMGLWLFGEAYLHALAYFLSVHRSGTRSIFYPNTKRRASILMEGAVNYGYEVPDGYIDLFIDLEEPDDTERHKKFLLQLADGARDDVLTPMMSEVDKRLTSSGIGKREASKVSECQVAYAKIVPPRRSGGLANIVNGAWNGLLDGDLWENPTHNDQKVEHLSEIVLKAIEVFEIEQRLGKS